MQWQLRFTTTIYEYERGLLYKQGRFVDTLQPGRYVFWRWEHAKVTPVNVQEQSQVIPSQEMLTADRVDVRLSLVAQYVVKDPVLAVMTVKSYTERLYQDLQIALRGAVAARELDAILNERTEMSAEVLGEAAPLAAAYGVELRRVGVRDIILPGAVRTVMLKEVEAERSGRADLVRARHEVAAARARANAAKIFADNPAMLRLQELDALRTMAYGAGNMILLPNLFDLLNPNKR